MKLTLLNSLALSSVFYGEEWCNSKEFGVFRVTFSGKLMQAVSAYKFFSEAFSDCCRHLNFTERDSRSRITTGRKWGAVQSSWWFLGGLQCPKEIGERLGQDSEGRFISGYTHRIWSQQKRVHVKITFGFFSDKYIETK